MNSIVLSTANAKTDYNHKLRLELTSDLDLQSNLISLSHCSVYYTWKNFKTEYGNTEFFYQEIATQNTVQATIPNGSYSVKDINNFIHQIMQQNKHDNSDGTYDINIYANTVYNRVTISVSNKFIFSMKAGLRETLGFDINQINITNGEFNGNLVPRLERVDTVLIHCNLVNNQVVHDSSIIYSFVPNQSFGTLLQVKPNYPLWRFARNANFNAIEVWFTDQDNKSLDMEDKVLVELQIKHKKHNLD